MSAREICASPVVLPWTTATGEDSKTVPAAVTS
jgi:hypothetical protein